jgi:hypothetical protein
MKDLDGTLTGKAGSIVIYNGNITQADSRCTPSSDTHLNGTVCTQMQNEIRFAFNHMKPDLPVIIEQAWRGHRHRHLGESSTSA